MTIQLGLRILKPQLLNLWINRRKKSIPRKKMRKRKSILININPDKCKEIFCIKNTCIPFKKIEWGDNFQIKMKKKNTILFL